MTEKEELQMLRELVKKQKLQLSEKDNMLREKDEVIRRQQIQIENMTQALLHARKRCLEDHPKSQQVIKANMRFDFLYMLRNKNY